MLSGPDPTDETLAERVARGDVAAFATLYDRYARRVYAWAAHLVGSAEAEDVVQETYLRLWDKAHQFDVRRGRFASWFMAIARHVVMGQLRRRTTQQLLIAADEIERVLADAAEPGGELACCERSSRARAGPAGSCSIARGCGRSAWPRRSCSRWRS